ncbi:DNA topoisomerase I, bacterial [Beggiatoa alba B18LD]|uniref:DNA topoisomerase 1 n=1 Tax=Beggiatoa alba B18LD TaxID=395493 RepID=I3CKJ4_9GAMM|nr:type I DNA topoisomerase [Beggiatoa alba]EIJ44137.1 DNA topoisomerase I, bacterial [Beggiatoa alba B18LD]
MAKNLVIVESPAKAKTIEKYLGKDFTVTASYGHVRDLLPKSGAVDPDNAFAMNYQLIEKNSKHVETIKKAIKQADTLYLATDPDREGEAISWHLYEILKENNLIGKKPVHRVAFYEITQQAVQDAIAHPRSLSSELINAQQARRALDYLVGFNLSPLLWKKIRRGLSAGRVQSPALRLIAEREQEIEAFKPLEYWTIEADNEKEKQKFVAKLNQYKGEKLTQFSINNTEQAHHARDELITLADGKLIVSKVEKKQRKRQPTAPFTTSTLQQEAARKLGFASKKTMQVAQQLYEGIDIGDGAVGLITYMRTDSVNLADEAIADIRDVIEKRYGKDNLPKNPVQYKTKAKNAQEAHEAIRPTSAHRYPDTLAKVLTIDQLKLYTLIWQRTIACQMTPAILDTVAVDLACGEGNNFRANGSTLVHAGFMAVYQEGVDDSKQGDEDEKMLPPLEVGEQVKVANIRAEQHFTEPPPRYSEASLVKALEEFGIGRPSTYATIISTLLQREYAILDKKRFYPTDVGRIVNKFLTEHFQRYVDYNFTAQLEDELDAISRGEKEWIPVMDKFWKKFKKLVDEKTETVQRKDVTQEVLDEACPKCGKPLTKRLGKRGSFIGCSAYPDCDYTRNIDGDNSNPAPAVEAVVVEGRACPLCNSALHVKQARNGSKFIGCSNYPTCKHTEPMPEDNTGVTCPACKTGTLVRRKSRFGTFFYSCSTYPTCNYAVSHQPIAEPCPQCGSPILTLKVTKRWGTQKVCPNKSCGFVENVATVTEPTTAE